LAVVGVAGSALASGSQPVLGGKAFAPMGEGFGTVAPPTIFNGGDPSGLVSHITWHHWGSRTATGSGKTSIFKPHGGYYPQLVRAQLRASRLGHCGKHGPRAYTHLEAREPSRPGGPLGKWFAWSGARSICRF
jgi:hypothetical protein